MTIHGIAEARFWPVAQAFERQLEATGGGAAVCVYYKGRKVVDVWGGARDEGGRPWLEDTMAMSFSTSKGITSTLIHILVDQLHIKLLEHPYRLGVLGPPQTESSTSVRNPST